MQRPILMQFKPRWKEELVCYCDEGAFLIDMTYSPNTVYFPSEAKWNHPNVPTWAAPHRSLIESQLAFWCAQEGIRLVVDDTGAVLPYH